MLTMVLKSLGYSGTHCEPLDICSVKPMTGFYRDLPQHRARGYWQSHGLRRDDFGVS
jgi:hypothetical protein